MPTATTAPKKPAQSPAPNSSQTPPRFRNLVLKGYIKGVHDGPFQGVCLTLNLVVRGKTIEETEEKLRDLIIAYLEDARKSGNWDDLVPRKAPFSYYQEYYALRLRSHFRSVAEFKLFVCSAPCPAHA